MVVTPMSRGLAFLVGALAVWRIAYAVTMEDGPARLLVRLRRVAARWGSVLDCFYCASVWIALPAALAIGTTGVERALMWPALSGAACLLHRITERGRAALYWEEPEDDHVLRKHPREPRTGANSR
jgi:hypothetical protein